MSDKWFSCYVLGSNPEQTGSDFWGYLNADRVTAIVATKIHDPVSGYDRDVWYPEVISPDINSSVTRVWLNEVSGGALSLNDCKAQIKTLLSSGDVE